MQLLRNCKNYSKYFKFDLETIVSVTFWVIGCYKLILKNDTDKNQWLFYLSLISSILFIQSLELYIKDYTYSKGIMNSKIVWKRWTKFLKPINRRLKLSQFRAIEYSTTIYLFVMTFAIFISLMASTVVIPNHQKITNALALSVIIFLINSINNLILSIFRVYNSEELEFNKFIIHYDDNGVPRKLFDRPFISHHEEVVIIELDYEKYEIDDLNRELKYLNSLNIRSSVSFYNKHFVAFLSLIIGLLFSKFDDFNLKQIVKLSIEKYLLVLMFLVYSLLLLPSISKVIKQILFKYTEDEIFLRIAVVQELIVKKSKYNI